MTSIARGMGRVGVGLATAIVIVTVAIIPFLTPAWVAFEQDRAQAAAWTGFSEPDLRAATEAILADLVLGPPAFDVTVAGVPVLNDRERGHMRDVRAVFSGLVVATVAAVVVLTLGGLRSRGTADGRSTARRDLWRAIGRGAAWLAVATVGLGVLALVAFDTLFEVFHRILFPAGSYAFDPGTERLVQLFPFQFWQETAIAVGVVIVVLATATAGIARRRGRAASTATDHAPVPAWTTSR